MLHQNTQQNWSLLDVLNLDNLGSLEARIGGIYFTSNGLLICSQPAYDTILIYDLQTKLLIESIVWAIGQFRYHYRKVHFHYQGLGNGIVQIFDLKSERFVGQVVVQIDRLIIPNFTTLSCSPDGKHMIGFCMRKFILIWSFQQNNLVSYLTRCKEVYSIRWSPTGCLVMFINFQKQNIQFWNLAKAKLVKNLQQLSHISMVDYSPEGSLFSQANSDGHVRVNCYQNLKQIRKFIGHQGEVNCVTFSADSRTLTSGGREKKIFIWDIRTGKGESKMSPRNEEVLYLQYSPDQKYLITEYPNRKMQIIQCHSNSQQ